MRFKLTLILLLANLAVFFLLWRLNQPQEIVARPAGAIPKDFSIDHIIIEDHANNEVRELTLDHKGAWHLVKPVEWLASESAVEDLINHLQFPDEATHFSLEDLKTSGETLNHYGLDKPTMEVTVFSGTHSAKLLIGHPVEYGNHLYIMNPADGLVRVVAQELLTTLDMPLDELRDNRLFTLQPFAVQSLSISATGSGSGSANAFTRFVFDGDQWRMDTPFSCAANGSLVNSAITQLDDLHAESFVPTADPTDARFGLATPSLKIELKGDASDTSQTLWLGSNVAGATENEYYAKLAEAPTVFLVKTATVFANLTDAQHALRERQFLDFEPEKVSTISVQLVDSPAVNMQMLEDHTWRIVSKDSSGAPTVIAADAGIIHAMLDNLHQLSAKNFASDAPTSDDLQSTFNLKSPQWKVTLQGDQGDKTLDIGRSLVTPSSPDAPSVRYYAKIEGADSVYEIDSDIISQLSADPLHYRDRILETLPDGAQIISLKIAQLKDNDLTAGDEIFNGTIDPTKSTWEEFLKDKSEVFREGVLGVLNSVRQFVVEDYRQAQFDEHYQMVLAQSTSGSIGPSPVPWRYRLDAGVQLSAAGGATPTVVPYIFYFSERYGSLQLGGTRDAPLPSAIFALPIQFKGALGSITDKLDQPAAAVQTLRELDQPINPHTAAPAASSKDAATTPASTPIMPAASPSPASAPAASPVAPTP
jgi:hypothetical protein